MRKSLWPAALAVVALMLITSSLIALYLVINRPKATVIDTQPTAIIQPVAEPTFTVSGNTLSVTDKGETTQSLSLSEQGVFALNVNKQNTPPAFITDKDVNFDGHNDVGVLVSTGYAGVNYFYDFYLYNPAMRNLVKSDALTEVVPTKIDAVKKQVLSTFKSGPGFVIVIYQWNGTTYEKSQAAAAQ